MGKVGFEARDCVVWRRRGVVDRRPFVVGLALGAGGRGPQQGEKKGGGEAKKAHGQKMIEMDGGAGINRSAGLES